MSATIAELRAGLATNLRTIADLEVYEREGGMINVPSAVVVTPTINYHQSFGANSLIRYDFRVTLFVQSADAEQQNYDLDQYLDNGSPTSVRAAIESDLTLGGAADSLTVTGFRPLDNEEVAGLGYWGGSFDVTVYAR